MCSWNRKEASVSEASYWKGKKRSGGWGMGGQNAWPCSHGDGPGTVCISRRRLWLQYGESIFRMLSRRLVKIIQDGQNEIGPEWNKKVDQSVRNQEIMKK